MTKTAIITGARKGIGLELAKMFVEMGWHVIGTTRDAKLHHKKIDGILYHLPTYCPINPTYLPINQKLDVLVNNAANSSDWVPGVSSVSALDIEYNHFSDQLCSNVVEPIRLIGLYHKWGVFSQGARIVNVVSGVGEFSHPDAFKDFQIGYATSKCALIMATKKIAAALQPHGIYCNAACPGWCKTDMGGPDAPRTAREGAESILKACFLDVENPPTGLYFRDGHRIKIEG